ITVSNVAPAPSLTAPSGVKEGGTVVLTPTVTDPGSADTFTYLWHVVATNGQVVPDGTTSTFTFVPNDNGSYTVSLTGSDDDGGVGSTQITFAAADVAPTVGLTGAAQVDEGSPFVLHFGSLVEPGRDTISQIQINWGDGQNTSVTTFADVTHVYANGSNNT